MMRWVFIGEFVFGLFVLGYNVVQIMDGQNWSFWGLIAGVMLTLTMPYVLYLTRSRHSNG
jgi:hypothetical protein